MPVHCYGWFFLHRSHLSSLHPSTTNKTAFWQVPKQLMLKDKWHFNQQIVKWSCLTKEKSVHHVQNISINPCVDWHEVTQYWFYLHNTVKPLSKKEHNKEKQDTMRSTKDRRLDIKISLRQTCCFYNCMSSGFVFLHLHYCLLAWHSVLAIDFRIYWIAPQNVNTSNLCGEPGILVAQPGAKSLGSCTNLG